MQPARMPSVSLEALRQVRFAYDHEGDIAFVHLGDARSSITEQVDDAWYIRLAGEMVTGIELHGFRGSLLATPFYATLARAAIDEIRTLAGQDVETGDIDVVASIETLPSAVLFCTFVVGQAVEKLEGVRRASALQAAEDLTRTG